MRSDTYRARADGVNEEEAGRRRENLGGKKTWRRRILVFDFVKLTKDFHEKTELHVVQSV